MKPKTESVNLLNRANKIILEAGANGDLGSIKAIQWGSRLLADNYESPLITPKERDSIVALGEILIQSLQINSTSKSR